MGGKGSKEGRDEEEVPKRGLKQKKEKAKKKKALPKQVIHTFNALYLGYVQLPDTAFPGVDACFQALDKIKELYVSEVDAKVSLTVSIYGIKALRTTFAGMNQSDASESVTGGVSFDVVVNENIIRVAFCSDLNKYFCFISQERDTGIMNCFAFDCGSSKVSRKVSKFTADACAKVFSTVHILRKALLVPKLDADTADDEGETSETEGSGSETLQEEANDGVVVEVENDVSPTSARATATAREKRAPSKRAGQEKKAAIQSSKGASAVDLLYFEGYVDADEQFQQEIFELAGLESIPYQEPSLYGPSAPTLRTMIRQADPNEYERTRL